MRTCLSGLLLALVVAPLWADDDPEPPGSMTRELKALQGTWKLTSLKVAGIDGLPGVAQKKLTLTFTKDKVTSTSEVAGKARADQMPFKIDPKKKPMHLDLADKKLARSVPAIYKIEKGQLHIAYPPKPDAKARPKGFDDMEVVHMVFQKEKGRK